MGTEGVAVWAEDESRATGESLCSFLTLFDSFSVMSGLGGM